MTSTLLILILLPSFLMVSLSLSSLATGIIISSCIIILMQLTKKPEAVITKSYLLTFAISGLWIFANPISIENSVHAKQVLSLAAILICGFAVTSLFKSRQKNLDNTIKTLFWILLAIGSTGAFDLFRPGNYQLLNRPLPPFSEASHFAIAFIPIACSFALLSSRNLRLFTCLACFTLAISLPNLTLLAGTVLISLIALSTRQAIIFLATTCIIGITIFLIDPGPLEYFLNRTSTSEDENISRLVYIQGWESMISALQFSNGFGIGFQNLGIEPSGQATLLLDNLTGSPLNRSDGSFLAAKLIGEFGVIGVAAVIYATTLSIRSGLLLRKHINKQDDQASYITPLCFTYTLLLELFVRGTGYFSPTLVITLFFAPKAINALKRKASTKNNLSHKIISR
jgi:hypothetical protein